MGSVTLLPSAEQDLEAIHEYTVSAWSAGQAQRYLFGLRESLDRLAGFPSMGVEIGSGVRVWHYQRHRIVYREAEDGIEVSRVFHSSRDVDLVLEHHAALRRHR